MPTFAKPAFEYSIDVAGEKRRLRSHKRERAIPEKTAGKLLAATWNIANLGAQERLKEHLQLIAEMLRWFDLVAIQECRERYADLAFLHELLPRTYRYVCSDSSGNDERMVFIYDSRKLMLLEEIGEIAFPPSSFRSITLNGVTGSFNGFDRTPYLASFRMGKTSILVLNVHLYYGTMQPKAKKIESMDRRTLETFAVARWADSRSRSKYSFTRELMAMGDFNMPKSLPGDSIYEALTKLGLEIPDHSSQIASNIADDANYDQVAFLPGTTKDCFTGRKGVFDFDQVIFPELWQKGTNQKNFASYLRYFISDHRPVWVELAF